jgi:hypothetical protein
MATDPVSPSPSPSPSPEHAEQEGAAAYAVGVLTNLPGTELRFDSREDLITFATIASGRVATTLEVLLKQIDDHMLAVVMENIADLAFQVHGAINALVASERAPADE